MKIICVGRNYADHAAEMGSAPPREPVLFLKPETALLPKNHPFHYPEHTAELHYEVELVIRINRLGKHIAEQFAHKYYDRVGIGIDFTARDTQRRAKEGGLPWETAKAFDHSAPVGSRFLPIDELRDPRDIRFELRQNRAVVQSGTSADMLFHFDALIAHISKYFTLKIGDLIFTGTPAGVGPVAIGDTFEAFIEDQPLLRLNVK